MPTTRPIENVWKYPRPPSLLPTTSHLRVVWTSPSGQSTTIASTKRGYRVLETSHPPTYYFPPEDVQMDLLKVSKARRTYCEWKGQALYHDLVLPGDATGKGASGGGAGGGAGAGGGGAAAAAVEEGPKGRIWSYPDPTKDFQPIKDYLCFYCSSSTPPTTVGSWSCFVDEDQATAQEGDFYGSWITPEITGGERGFKGGAGTWGW